MRIFLIIFFSIIAFPKLVINEFQPAPNGDEPEWIELYNDADFFLTVDSVLIGDSKSLKLINKIELPPYSYLVLVQDFDAFDKVYDLPSEQLLEFKFATLNNTTDEIRLLNTDSTIIDSLYYDVSWGEKGKSFERIDPELPANFDNLAFCKDPKGGTPGAKNSNREVLIDLSLEYIVKLDTTLAFKIKNIGKLDVDQFDIDLVVDINRDRIFDSKEFLISEYQNGIASLDSLILSYNISNIIQEKDIDIFGSFNSIAYITVSEDENASNDTIHYELILPTKSGAVLINEIMYDVDDLSAEYIEIYNNSNFVINLKGWKIYDKSEWDKNQGVTINKDVIVNPGDYTLICWDEKIINSFPDLEFDNNVILLDRNISLNKSNDLIVIKDAENLVIDSVTYFDSWHDKSILQTQNVSLEKIKYNLESSLEANWTSSTNFFGGSPLLENSFNNQLSDYYGVLVTPNPFSPHNHLIGKACDITFNLPYDRSVVSLNLYDQSGNIITKILESQYSGSSGVYEWNGADQNGKLLQTGAYILYIEAKDRNSGETYSDKLLVVIGNN